MIPTSSPADSQGLDLILGGVDFSPSYIYECRFLCETTFCSDLFFTSAIIPAVRSPARFVSDSMLSCTIPTWPFQASPTIVSVWRGSFQVQKDNILSNANLDIFTFFGAFSNYGSSARLLILIHLLCRGLAISVRLEYASNTIRPHHYNWLRIPLPRQRISVSLFGKPYAPRTIHHHHSYIGQLELSLLPDAALAVRGRDRREPLSDTQRDQSGKAWRARSALLSRRVL
jgi:hypothetical protein